jgi:hypothetical protein
MHLDTLRRAATSIKQKSLHQFRELRAAPSESLGSRVRAFVKSWFWVVHLGTDCIESYRQTGTPPMAPAPSLPSPATIGGHLSTPKVFLFRLPHLLIAQKGKQKVTSSSAMPAAELLC